MMETKHTLLSTKRKRAQHPASKRPLSVHTPGRPPAGKQVADKSDAILKSATYLFLKHGYSSTTMDSIAAHARVTKQTVYAYYADKDTLFVQMISRLCQKHAPAKALLEDHNLSTEELMNRIGLAFLTLITHPDVLSATRLVISESDRHPKLAQLYYDSGTQRLVSVLTQFLERQIARGVMAIPNPKSAASYFLAMLKGQYYLRMILRLKPAPTEHAKVKHVKETVQIFMRLYASETPMVTQSTL